MKDVRIAVAGATGAVGKDVLLVLDKAPWRPKKVVALASAKSTVPRVSYGDDEIVVEDIEGFDFSTVDAAILAVPGDAARAAGEDAIGAGVPVVDLSGVFAAEGEAPFVVPWVNPEALNELPRGVVSVPSAGTLALVSALGPLWRAGLAGRVVATVLAPASTEGKQGVEELSRQVVALFNSATPPRKVFEQGLAFDLVPQLGELSPSGATAREARDEAELQEMLGAGDVSVEIVLVPVFSGLGATLWFEPARPTDLATIERVLRDGGASMPKGAGARHQPRPRKVEGQPFVNVGRIRQQGKGFRIWLSMDNLRGAATVAVACAGALLKAR